ncbi:MAG: YfhO family protein [Nanoarchaeota archaeon]
MNMKGWGAHKYHLAAICLLVIAVFFPLLHLHQIPPFGNDFSENHVMLFSQLRDAWFKYQSLYPQWNPLVLSGTPLYSKLLGPGPLYPLNILMFFTSDAISFANLIHLFSYLLAGITMYVLAYHLTKSKAASLVAAIIYVLNGYSMMLFSKGWSEYIRAFALSPLVFLCVHQAVRAKKFIVPVVIAAIILFFQLETGGANIILWTLFMIGLYLAFSVIGPRMHLRAMKLGAIGILLLLLFFGLGAIRLLPYQEINRLSPRAEGATETEALVYQKIDWRCTADSYRCLKDLVEPGFPRFDRTGFDFKIGLIGLCLVIVALVYRFKNRTVLFFGLLLLLIVLLALGTKLMYLLWKFVPGFSTHRYPHRALFLFGFAASILGAFGAKTLFDRWPKRKTILLVALSALLVFDLGVIGTHHYPFMSYPALKDQYPIYEYIGSDPGLFRVQPLEFYGLDKGLVPLALTFDLEFVYGYDTLWEFDYLPVHLTAVNANPPKMFGMLNVKYFTSKTSVNKTGMEFIKQFPYTPEALDNSNQTFLYLNQMYLPRAYIAERSILIIGNSKELQQAPYSLLLLPDFKPQSMAIILAKDSKVQDIAPSLLHRFDAVILMPGSVDSTSNPVLAAYVESGGTLLPDLTKGKSEITMEDVVSFFQRIDENVSYADVQEVKHKVYEPDRRVLETNRQEGFLVLSEKFALSGQWRAEGHDILMADGVLTAIPLNGDEDEVVVEFHSPGFEKGKVISLITAILVLGYLGFEVFRKKRSATKETKNE